MSKTLEPSINVLKEIYEHINKDKEELKLKISNIFTKIRNTLNEREDELILEVNKEFDNLFFKEELIKESEKLPSVIKSSLEKSKIVENEWENKNKLKYLINYCIIIENNINNMKIINEKLEKAKLSADLEVKFTSEEIINKFLEDILKFGNIYYNEKYSFKNCPKDIDEKKQYIIEGEMKNILTKMGSTGTWVGVSCQNRLEKLREYKWKIKIFKNKNNDNYDIFDNYNNYYYNNYNNNYKNYSFMVGVAPIDFDENASYNYGWYFCCHNSTLYSGPPHNYKGKATNLNQLKNEIIIVLNLKKQTLKFIIDNQDKGESYTNIPNDKPLTPVVFLYNKNDKVEINDIID